MSKMMSGTPILMGDNTIPGLMLHKEVEAVLPDIEKACRDMGLDYYPIIVEMVAYDTMSELASYGGFPVRYPHWRFGMEYEQLSRGYEYSQHRISEMVINTNPCLIYCMDSNTLIDNVDVIAHAIGHNDFFKNNIFFGPTNENMMNKMANHGSRIRNYIKRYGDEVVADFIDDVLRLDTLIDYSNKAWNKKVTKNIIYKDEKNYRQPNRINVENDYMDSWINTKEYKEREKDKIAKEEMIDQLNIFRGEERDIMGYIKDNAPLKPWQQDIISMLYEEAMYFAPQRQTKMLNEGWASYVDYHLMCREGLCSLGQSSHDKGIVHYAKHKMQVLGGKYSQNPYKIGFELLMDIEDRWNKGKFGKEYEECTNMKEKANWDKKLGLGKEKVFEVRELYNDYTAINEFFTPEFCEEKEFFEYKRKPDGKWVIVDKDFKSLKNKMLKKYLNGGLPDIRLVDPNHKGKGHFLMQHKWTGESLHDPHTKEVTASICKLWRNTVVLATKEGDNEVVYVASPDSKEVQKMSRESYESKN